MDEEKELVRKIRNSFNSGKSEAEITKTLQEQGLKIEYIMLLIKKAKRRKLIITFFIILFIMFLVVIIMSGIIGYGLFLKAPTIENKENLTNLKGEGNPLKGLKVIFTEKPSPSVPNEESQEKEIYLEDIEITDEFITYLLTQLGALQLKPNPLNNELPSINFEIEDKKFNSIVENKQIKTTNILSSSPDAVFYSDKESIVRAIISDNPVEEFKKSYNEGKCTFELKKSNIELLAKGYISLYNSLKN